MKNLIVNMLQENAEYREFLEYRSDNNKNDIKDHKHRNFKETESTDFVSIHIENNLHSKIKNEIKAVYFLKEEEEELILSEIEIEKKIKYNNDVFTINYTFELDELDYDFFSLSLKIQHGDNDLFIEVNQSFEALNYYARNDIDTENNNFKKLRESFEIFSKIENTEIVKAYLQLFIFNKPINKEEKELFLISTDVNLHELEIIDHFGYDFKQDMVNPENLLVNNASKYKTIKFR